jgi:putative transposase
MVGSGTAGVVLAHEYPADLCGFWPFAGYLGKRGLRAFDIDLRCFGLSACPEGDARGRVVDDIAAAVAELRHRGVTKSHSRPHVSNDNPYSESQFKTLKYRPEFPDGSARSRTPAPSASSSSAGTTSPTIIRASGCWSPPMSTTAAPGRSESPGSGCSLPPTPPIPSGSSVSHPSHRPCQPSPGSTSPTPQRRPPSNSLTLVPHPG